MHGEPRVAVGRGVCRILGMAWLLFATCASAAIELDEQLLAIPFAPAGGATNFPSNVSIAIDPLDSLLHAAFASPSGAIYHAKRTGTGWAVDRIDSLGRSGLAAAFPRLAFDALGVGHLVYVNTRFLPPGSVSRGPQILYRSLVGGVWTAAEPTTPSEIIFTNLVRDLEMEVSGDGSVVAVVASRANAPAIAQLRGPTGWGARETLTSAGQASATVAADGSALLGLATQAGTGFLLNLIPSGGTTVEQQLPGSHDLLRVLARTSVAGDLHAAWIDDVRSLNYWLRHPAEGWHAVPIPAAVSSAALSTAAGNDFRFTLSSVSGLPWFLTSRGTGGFVNGARLALTYATDNTWTTDFLDQAPGFDWRDGGTTLGSMLQASIALDARNRCHVVWQQLDTATAGLRIRHVLVSPVPSPLLDAGQNRPGQAGLRMDVPAVLRGGVLQLKLQGGSGASAVPARLEILDIAGRRIWRDRLSLSGSTTAHVDLTGSDPGLYFVRCEAGERRVTARFSIVR